MANEFLLEIVTPDRNFFKGMIQSLIINTSQGEIGILSNIEPILTNLAAGVVKFKQNDKWGTAATGEGFVEVRPEGVIILCQSADWPHEISAEKVQREIDELEEHMRKMESLRDYKEAKAHLARQFAKLRAKRNGLD